MTKLNILSILSNLTIIIYNYSDKFPKLENYTLSQQLRRAIISVRLNIREGNTFSKDNKKRFFKIALGSLEEVDECLNIAFELKYITKEQFEKYREIYWHVFNMLNKLIKSIRSDSK